MVSGGIRFTHGQILFLLISQCNLQPLRDLQSNIILDPEYFGDGLAEQIINSLTTVNELKVIGRTSSFQFKGQNLDLRKIGKTLNVGLILEGSIQVDGKKLRITAQLIRVSDNTHIWSQQYDRELTEIFRIQDDIALQITDRLKIALTDQQKHFLPLKLYRPGEDRSGQAPVDLF